MTVGAAEVAVVASPSDADGGAVDSSRGSFSGPAVSGMAWNASESL